jgi:hypothetical protein
VRSRARTKIALPASALERFVGEYSFGPRTASITLDGDRLVVHVANKPPHHLLATSPNTFFIAAAPGATFTLVTDRAGNVTGLAMADGGSRSIAGRVHLPR